MFGLINLQTPDAEECVSQRLFATPFVNTRIRDCREPSCGRALSKQESRTDSSAAGKVALVGSGFLCTEDQETDPSKKVAQCSDKQERFANSPWQRAFVYLDLPSVARPASDSNLGKVSGWMIRIGWQ